MTWRWLPKRFRQKRRSPYNNFKEFISKLLPNPHKSADILKPFQKFQPQALI